MIKLCSIYKLNLVIFLLLFFPLLFPSVCQAANNFQTGWWIDRDKTPNSMVSTYASQGNTLVLLAGWFDSTSQIQGTLDYLRQAQQSGTKMIIGLEGGPAPTMNIADFTSVVNSLKNSNYGSSIFGWYIGDEPELTNDQSLIQSRHTTLKTYYSLLKSLDSTRPVIISFNQPYNQSQWNNQAVFYDAVDIVGIHSYPFWTGSEFGTDEGRSVYDVWQKGLANSKSLGKDFIATCQGFGDGHGSPYRTPTINELRYQVFTAMVQGVDKVLFWIDSWGKSSDMMDMIKNQINQIQSIGLEMNNGKTNDSQIGVSITDRNQLVYRYGTSAANQVILAVNIANRTSPNGRSLSNVQFSLPAGIRPSQVEVVGENRTIPVNANGVFTDTFNPYTVHIYKFSSSAPVPTTTVTPFLSPTITITTTPVPYSTSVPSFHPSVTPTATLIPTIIPSITPFNTPPVANCALKNKGDANCDNFINPDDYVIWNGEFVNKNSLFSDFDNDNKITLTDFEIWRRNTSSN
jgi:hypothetical protein